MPPQPSLTLVQMFVTYTDVFGGTVAEEDLVNFLKTLGKEKTLVLLTQIGFILHNEKASDATVQRYIATQCFDPEDLSNIDGVIRRLKENNEGVLVLFSELQVLNLMKLVILHGSEDTNLDYTAEERLKFGRCCLMMNNLLMRPFPKRTNENTDEVRRMIRDELLRNGLFQYRERFGDAFMRARELFLTVPETLKDHPEFFNIPAAFAKAAGMTLDEFLTAGYTIWAWWREITMATLEGSAHFVINRKTFFTETVRQELCEKVMEQLCLSLEEYKAVLENERSCSDGAWHSRYTNMTIEHFPLVRSGDIIICLHMKALERMLTSNIFYVINNSLPENQRHRFRTFFGRVFEAYVRSILKRSLEKRCVMQTYGGSGKEAGEAILVYPRALILIEAKSSRLSPHVFTLGDFENYKASLRRIVVAGARQIQRVIDDFQAGEFVMEGVRRDNIGRFYPVIVTVHALPQEAFLRAEIDNLLREENVLQNSSVAPVTLLSIEELEYLEPLMNTFSLLEILGDKTGNKDYNDVSMKSFLYDRYKTLPNNEFIRAQFRSFSLSMKHMVFPEERSERGQGPTEA
jgi:hypothetical protein